ncbi:MAG: DNA-3-methyladenine glycosylase 2 family protein [Flavobacterium sp.]|nr:DNA-3-methyladenine glycosylase 2 family protein [Flavobacterium sp.]
MKEAFDFLTNQEPIFKTIVNQYGLPTIPSRPQGFETLVLQILEQQVSIDSAKATYLRLREKALALSPEKLVEFSEEDFRSVGVSRQKANYIKGLSQIIISKEIHLESLSQKTTVEVREELIKIKGIGHWTIDVYLMFSLQAADVFPIGDVAVVNTIKELFDLHSKEEMLLLAEKWSPFRSHATFLLWHHYLNKRNRKISYNYK